MQFQIANSKFTIVVCEQLLTELKIVTAREKLKKYFPKNSVKEMIELLETIAENVEIEANHQLSRDPKDNFILDLIDCSKADFLVTGDKDLLVLNITNPNTKKSKT